MPVLSDIVVKFFRSIVVLTQNGNFLFEATIAFGERCAMYVLHIACKCATKKEMSTVVSTENIITVRAKREAMDL